MKRVLNAIPYWDRVYRALFCEGQAMGLPPAFHAAAATERWATGSHLRVELYTHLLNKRCLGWLSLALFPGTCLPSTVTNPKKTGIRPESASSVFL